MGESSLAHKRLLDGQLITGIAWCAACSVRAHANELHPGQTLLCYPLLMQSGLVQESLLALVHRRGHGRNGGSPPSNCLTVCSAATSATNHGSCLHPEGAADGWLAAACVATDTRLQHSSARLHVRTCCAVRLQGSSWPPGCPLWQVGAALFVLHGTTSALALLAQGPGPGEPQLTCVCLQFTEAASNMHDLTRWAC